MGDRDSLAGLLPGSADPGSLAVVGIAGAVVVDTPDALLVTTRAHAQALEEVIGGWRAAGREDLL